MKYDIKQLMNSWCKLMLALLCLAVPFAAKAHHILDYETGEFFEGNIWNEDYYHREEITTNSTSAIMEFNIRYAAIDKGLPALGENCVTWNLPTFSTLFVAGKPQVSYNSYEIHLPTGYKSASVTILEAEYKDFNFELQPCTVPLEEDISELFMRPYQGFFPTSLVTTFFQEFRGEDIAYVDVWPVAYDYEHKIVRAYSHLKIRLDYLEEEAGIEEVGADDAPAEYFNLQGVRVDKPEHGVYIERKGGKATKVVY